MVLGISISPFLLHVLLFWVCNILLPSQHGKKPKPKKNSYFLQNDHLMVECTYNTSSKEAFTRGGFSARDEMCLVFMHYYPASNLAHCASRLSFQHVLLALGINVWPLTPPTQHLTFTFTQNLSSFTLHTYNTDKKISFFGFYLFC